jgi:polyisoprenoid-binding protein YceI
MKINRTTSLILFTLIVIIGIVLGIRNNTEDTTDSIVPEPVADVAENADTTDAEVIVTDSHRIDTEASLVTWTARKKLIPNYIDAGTFNVAEGSVDFEDDTLTGGSVVIDVSSLEVTETGVGGGFSGLARDMLSGRFLDVEQYQTASFAITSVEKKNRDTFEITGDMTIKGVTNEVAALVDVTFAEDGTALLVTDFEIDRTDYDITFGSDRFFDNLGDKVIDDVVVLEVVLQAHRI